MLQQRQSFLGLMKARVVFRRMEEEVCTLFENPYHPRWSCWLTVKEIASFVHFHGFLHKLLDEVCNIPNILLGRLNMSANVYSDISKSRFWNPSWRESIGTSERTKQQSASTMSVNLNASPGTTIDAAQRFATLTIFMPLILLIYRRMILGYLSKSNLCVTMPPTRYDVAPSSSVSFSKTQNGCFKVSIFPRSSCEPKIMTGFCDMKKNNFEESSGAVRKTTPSRRRRRHDDERHHCHSHCPQNALTPIPLGLYEVRRNRLR